MPIQNLFTDFRFVTKLRRQSVRQRHQLRDRASVSFRLRRRLRATTFIAPPRVVSRTLLAVPVPPRRRCAPPAPRASCRLATASARRAPARPARHRLRLVGISALLLLVLVQLAPVDRARRDFDLKDNQVGRDVDHYIRSLSQQRHFVPLLFSIFVRKALAKERGQMRA